MICLTARLYPLLEGKRALPDVGADWAFKYLTLTRIVSPEDYPAGKELVLAQVQKMANRHEPNVIDYFSRLDEIINVMEQTFPTFKYIHMEINVPKYKRNTGLKLCWHPGFSIKVSSEITK